MSKATDTLENLLNRLFSMHPDEAEAEAAKEKQIKAKRRFKGSGRFEVTPLIRSELSIDRSAGEDGPILTLTGELDLTTTPALSAVLIPLCAASPGLVVTLDMQGVEYIDSAGLAVMIAAARLLRPVQSVLRVLVTEGRQVDRVLALGRFSAVMEIVSFPEIVPETDTII